MKNIKVYNCFTVVSEDNPNNKKEVFSQPSLVDPLEKVPTLEEYVSRYVATGDLSVLPFSNRQIDELDDAEDDEDFSSPLYDKDADIEDLKDYKDEVDSIVSHEKEKQSLIKKAGEKVLTEDEVERLRSFINKSSQDTTKNKESNSQTNVVSENDYK